VTAKTGVIYDEAYKEHRPRWNHPERPERCDAVLRGIVEAVPEQKRTALLPRRASEEDVGRCHTPEYIEAVREDVAAGHGFLRTGDTDISEGTLDAALVAAGGVLSAVDAVMEGEVGNAFCAVRPPGHHATPDRGMGFCVFNNVAIGTRYVQERHGIERILIVDWDVHHGNGTQEVFYEDGSVFYFSVHQWPLYPGTGTVREQGMGAGRGTTLNCPLAMGCGRREVMAAFQDRLVPAMRSFRPQFVFVSAGFDGGRDDPLGGLELTAGDFAEMTSRVAGLSGEYCGGRLVSSLEGGYDLEELGAAAGAHVKALSDFWD